MTLSESCKKINILDSLSASRDRLIHVYLCQLFFLTVGIVGKESYWVISVSTDVCPSLASIKSFFFAGQGLKCIEVLKSQTH